MNVTRWADHNLNSLGDFDAFVSDGRIWRSRAVHDHAARLATGLVALGLAPGDCVLLWLPNSAELVVAWRAVLRAGGVAVVAHRGAPLQQIRHFVAETQATTIVTLAPLGDDSLGESVRHRIHIAPEELPGSFSLSRLIAEQRPLRDPVPRSADDVALIQYTSGSTGSPKGVITRHGALVARLQNLRPRRFARWRRPVRNLSVLPMSSSFGSLPLFEGLGRRCTHVMLDHFDPEAVLGAVQAHRIQKTFLVPTMCEAILAVPNLERFDLSSLKTVACGGAVVTPSLIERFEAACGIRLDVRYGMTGVGGVSWASPTSKPGAVGKPFEHLKARVVDPLGNPLPAGEVGELMLFLPKGTTIEYWNPGATSSAADAPEEWHRTGDLARFDADGELFIIGRSDDLIIQGGHNVYGEAVAEIVRQLPEVGECAVVGVPSDFLGQEVVACVALREGTALAVSDIIAHCRKHLEGLAAPTSVWFVDALPRNESGKVKNFELRDAIQAARAGAHDTGLWQRLAATPSSDRRTALQQEVERMLREVMGESRSDHAPAASFQARGLDSLGAMELTHVLSEAIGRPVPATLAYSHPTIDAACDLLLELMGWPHSTDVASAGPPPTPVAEEREIRLGSFLSESELDAAASLVASREAQQRAEVVFLTGANGFVGRFIALEILERLPANGRLYCLVRAATRSAAVERFRDAFGSDAVRLALLDQQMESGRLIVVEGDVTQTHFGLPPEHYEQLCTAVDCIVHNAAVVDHILGYRELFAPNVLGTVEIIRFAVTQRAKTINYVSTIAVQREDGTNPTSLAAGYAATKRASERLLKELHDRVGIPVRIYRPSHIMAHSTSPGQINAQDTLTRLLHGIVMTSLAPRSFYVEGSAGSAAWYDGLPVDSVAASIVALSLPGQRDRTGYVEYNIVNPHRDVGLDQIAGWLTSAGYRVERADDYGAWHRAFRSRLDSLSRAARQQSLLPLLHTWEEPRGRGRTYDTAAYRRDLAIVSRDAGTPPAGEAPRITEVFIHKCLRDMVALGMIPAADGLSP